MHNEMRLSLTATLQLLYRIQTTLLTRIYGCSEVSLSNSIRYVKPILYEVLQFCAFILADSDTNSSSTGLTSDEKLVDIRPSQIYMFSFKEV